MSQNYTVKETSFNKAFESRYGTMHSYNLTLVDARGDEFPCYINQKEATAAPIEGQVLYGYIKDDDFGNPKFNKEQAPEGHGHHAPRAAAPAPATAKPVQQQAFNEDERQTVIVRQNALTNANSNAAARSQVFIAQEKYEDAERVLKPSSISFIQHWFYKASMGEWRMDMKVGDALELMGFSTDDIDAFVFERQAQMETQADKESLEESNNG